MLGLRSMSTSKSLLLCRPDHYDVVYKINPWMDLTKTPAQGLAQTQWNNLFETLKRLEVPLELVSQTKSQPDMVFTANAGLVQGKRCMLARFRHKERQGEEAGFRAWFEQHGYAVSTPRSGSFEGEGDALFSAPDILFTGYGFRSDRAVSDELGVLFNLKAVVSCELVDPRFYHLDTCFAPLNKDSAIFFPAAFTKDSVRLMERDIELLPVPEDDALKFACNAVILGDQVVLPAGCAATEKLLQGRGFKTYPVQLDEFMKAGGAAKCLSLILS